MQSSRRCEKSDWTQILISCHAEVLEKHFLCSLNILPVEVHNGFGSNVSRQSYYCNSSDKREQRSEVNSGKYNDGGKD